MQGIRACVCACSVGSCFFHVQYWQEFLRTLWTEFKKTPQGQFQKHIRSLQHKLSFFVVSPPDHFPHSLTLHCPAQWQMLMKRTFWIHPFSLNAQFCLFLCCGQFNRSYRVGNITSRGSSLLSPSVQLTSFPNPREIFRKHVQLWIIPTLGVGPWAVLWPLLFMKYYKSFTLNCCKSQIFVQPCSPLLNCFLVKITHMVIYYFNSKTSQAFTTKLIMIAHFKLFNLRLVASVNFRARV